MEKRTVYILRSDQNPDRHYTGLASDVAMRLQWHNAGQNVATAKGRPWRIIVSIEFSSEKDAVRFERYLKSGSGRAFTKRHFPQNPAGWTNARRMSKIPTQVRRNAGGVEPA